jgi:hypothetical protein
MIYVEKIGLMRGCGDTDNRADTTRTYVLHNKITKTDSLSTPVTQ